METILRATPAPAYPPRATLILGAEPPLTPPSLLRRLNPGLAVRICDAAGDEGLDAIVAPYGERRPGWRSAPLWSEPLAVYVGPDHALATRPALEPADLAGAALITCGAWTGTVLANLGASPAHIHYSGDWRDVAALVAEGFGVAIAGCSAAETFAPRVLRIPIDGWLTYCAYWPEGGDTPALRRLLEHPHG